MNLRVTVAPAGPPPRGAADRAIQAAIAYLAAGGGGPVELGPGLYRLNNSVRLRSRVSLVGAGADSVLLKEPSETVPLVEDTDWYESRVTVASAAPFRVGGGVMLSGKCPHSGMAQVTIHTVLAIEGNTLWLNNMARGADAPSHLGNFWVGHEATASTLFSLVTGNWIEDVQVADLRLDGNRGKSGPLNGNYGGALYFQDCCRVHLRGVEVGDMESDGLSFQIVHDLTVEGCVFRNTANGIHPGSGSQRPIIRGNNIRGCSRHGVSWCWGVKHGLMEGNTIEECGTGISIGHRDTNNVMRGNTVRRCPDGGLVYRDDPPRQAAHDNLIEGNLFEDTGTLDAPGIGIDVDAPVRGNVLRGNRIVCTRPGLMRAGIRIGRQVESVALEGNSVEGIPVKVEDLREIT